MRKKYIGFKVIKEKLKTKMFVVYSLEKGAGLGQIYWHGSWRQYIFSPFEDTIWSVSCLQEVQDFINKLKEERKSDRNE